MFIQLTVECQYQLIIKSIHFMDNPIGRSSSGKIVWIGIRNPAPGLATTHNQSESTDGLIYV